MEARDCSAAHEPASLGHDSKGLVSNEAEVEGQHHACPLAATCMLGSPHPFIHMRQGIFSNDTYYVSCFYNGIIFCVRSTVHRPTIEYSY